MLVVLCVGMLLTACSSSSYSSNGYSSTYNSDSSYRKNVNDIASAYGEDPKHVDAVINALANSN